MSSERGVAISFPYNYLLFVKKILPFFVSVNTLLAVLEYINGNEKLAVQNEN